MKISIVTVCYNSEDLIGDTIRSIVSQKTDQDEYIIIDGASTDGTADVVRSFGSAIDKFISEPDDGQYHAIAKGFSLATGDVMCWVNADDLLMPWTLKLVRSIFERNPDVAWITGLPSFLDKSGVLTGIHSKLASYPSSFIANGWYNKTTAGYLQQENMFWRRSLWERVGGLDTRLSLAADFNLWRRFAAHADLVPVGVPLAAFRELIGEQRSSRLADRYEAEVIADSAGLPRPPWLWRWLSGKGVTARSIARLITLRRGDAIIYSRHLRDWVKVPGVRSVSRTSVSGLIEQFRTRGKPSATGAAADGSAG